MVLFDFELIGVEKSSIHVLISHSVEAFKPLHFNNELDAKHYDHRHALTLPSALFSLSSYPQCTSIQLVLKKVPTDDFGKNSFFTDSLKS